jgi:hypothetical protein
MTWSVSAGAGCDAAAKITATTNAAVERLAPRLMAERLSAERL